MSINVTNSVVYQGSIEGPNQNNNTTNSSGNITSGVSNTVLGVYAGNSITGGSYNTVFGNNSGYSITNGSYNTTLGNYAGYSIAGGSSNTTIGNYAGNAITSGASNTALGNNAGYRVTSGSNNLLMGATAGAYISSGSSNLIMGLAVAQTLTTGSSNIIIGNSASIDVPTAATSNMLNIGNTVYGDLTNIRLSVGVTTPSKDLSLSGQSAKIVGQERMTTAATPGTNLTINAGGSAIGGTDLAGGSLILQGGVSTGAGASGISLQTCVAAGSGTADNTPATMLQVTGNAIGLFGVAPVAKPTLTGSKASGAALVSLIAAGVALGLWTDSTTA